MMYVIVALAVFVIVLYIYKIWKLTKPIDVYPYEELPIKAILFIIHTAGLILTLFAIFMATLFLK